MASDVQHRINRLSGFIIFLFVLLIGWQSYWQLYKSDWLMAQPTNRRTSRAEVKTPRGVIFDRHDTRLAWSAEGKREYTDPRATAAVLGYLDPVYGRVGVEGDWDLELAGLSQKFTPQDLQRILKDEQPRGNDLALTLDLRLQQAALRALGSHKGAVVALDPTTGGILAMATSPTFDTSRLRQDYPTWSKSDDGVLRNRATQDLYPPGSTMKVVTAAAALMNGVSENTRYTCHGKTKLGSTTIVDYHGEVHGNIAMTKALAQSCNYYFARTATELGQEKFFATAEAFGFNQRWWTKLPDPRMLPLEVTESTVAKNLKRRLPLGEFAQMGFGQATVVATPLQIAMVASAIANGGTLMAPYLVSEVRKGGTKEVLKKFDSVQIGYPMDALHAEKLTDMMRRVVTSGTGTSANVSGVTVYGKTGTAQQNGGDDHAWFMGFGEIKHGAKSQRIAFAVVIERGGTGGRIAAPVARDVLKAWRDEH
ncbi:MAG TPA: penicillin-binding protein 2 [Armatimonadota bacterium]|nr:penicillin-binding protein 2 [Armatimonadota bacterium]